MTHITAKEAREISDENLQGPVIDHFLAAIDEKIKDVAKEGENKFDPWAHLSSFSMRYLPTSAQKEAIRKHYEAQGFTWKDYNDPDPGHPCSRPYTLISW